MAKVLLSKERFALPKAAALLVPAKSVLWLARSLIWQETAPLLVARLDFGQAKRLQVKK